MSQYSGWTDWPRKRNLASFRRGGFMRALDARGLPAASGDLIPSLLIAAYTSVAFGARAPCGRHRSRAPGSMPLAWINST